MTLCDILVLLVPIKDCALKIYLDYKEINNIIIMYNHFIPRLDDILDQLHGFCLFFKFHLKNEYHQIKIKKVINEKMLLKLDIICMSS